MLRHVKSEQMYVLVSENGGVYAARDKQRHRVVQLFREEDDAIRYCIMLEAEDFQTELEVSPATLGSVVANCKKYGYNYCIVDSDQLLIPPLDL